MPIRVAIVDDSPFTCGLLAEYLADKPGVQVIGTAHSGAAAIELVKTQKPDVLTLDVEMPDADGVSVLRRLMRESPLPIVMVSGLSRRAAEITHAAITEGAVDFVLKYSATNNLDTAAFERDFTMRVREAGRRRCIVGWALQPVASPRDTHQFTHQLALMGKSARPTNRDSTPVIVIGSSTGGPSAMQQLFGKWPHGINAAIIIVQHMPPGFTKALALQLDRISDINVREAIDRDQLTAGTAFVVPGDFHLVINSDHRVEVTQSEKVSGHRPSIDVTMQSVAKVFGSRAIGVILTGMGHDGVEGLGAIHTANGTTLAQDAESCVVNGMPQRAIDCGIVHFIGTPAAIGTELVRLTSPVAQAARLNRVTKDDSTRIPSVGEPPALRMKAQP